MNITGSYGHSAQAESLCPTRIFPQQGVIFFATSRAIFFHTCFRHIHLLHFAEILKVGGKGESCKAKALGGVAKYFAMEQFCVISIMGR